LRFVYASLESGKNFVLLTSAISLESRDISQVSKILYRCYLRGEKILIVGSEF
jgi:phosphoheptose isomerase